MITRRAGLPPAPPCWRGPPWAEWPDRNLRFIVPFPPGGAADIAGRMLAAHLQGVLNRPVVVENRGGAGSSIGVDAWRSRRRTGT